MLLALALAAAAPAPGDCREDPDDVIALVADRVRRDAGVPIAVRAVAGTPYSGYRDVPFACVRDVEVTDPKLATWNARRSTVTIRKDVPPGTSVTLRYRTGEEARKLTLVVADPEKATLDLTLRQKALDGCSGEPLGELVLDTENRFAVTFQPFESYKDYWGHYTYDPATGHVVMTIEGGNAIEKDADLDGTLRKTAAGWTFEGVNFGRVRASAAAGCTYRF